MAPTVRKRVAIHATNYRKLGDDYGQAAWMTIDGRLVLRFDAIRIPENSDRSAERHGLNEGPLFFSRRHVSAALRDSLNLSIDEILASEHVLIRAFGMLDRRLGKRRLRAMRSTIAEEGPLAQRLYYLRCAAEGLRGMEVPEAHRDLGSSIDQGWSRFLRFRMRLESRFWNPDGAGLNDDRLEQRVEEVFDQIVAQEKAAELAALAKLATSDRTRKLPALLAGLRSGEIGADDVDTPVAAEIHAGMSSAGDPERLATELLLLDRRSKLLRERRTARAAVALLGQPADRLRPLGDWQAPSRSPALQLFSLARHLWARYPVPAFMDHAWTHGDALEQQWFRDVGAGRNIRRSAGLPVTLTRRMAHHFLEAPDTYTLTAALRWAQVHALGGDRKIADGLLDTRLVRDFSNDAFWLSVLRFFVRNPMLDPTHYNPIVDYIWARRFQPRLGDVAAGEPEHLGPEQPDFTMRGRTVAALLRAVDAWHGRLRRERGGETITWAKSEIEGLVFVAGSHREPEKRRTWRIRELLSSRELAIEGRRLLHCVASYVDSCRRGLVSIFSLSLETGAETARLLTIECQRPSRTIVQIRGRFNRRAEEEEMRIVRRWAEREGIEIADHV